MSELGAAGEVHAPNVWCPGDDSCPGATPHESMAERQNAESVRLQKQIASLKRKVANLEHQLSWAEREQAITQAWAEKAYEEAHWLHGLVERYFEAGIRINLEQAEAARNDGSACD